MMEFVFFFKKVEFSASDYNLEESLKYTSY